MNRLAVRIDFSRHRSITAALLVALMGMLTACGGGGSPSASGSVPPVQLTSIAVGPPDASVAMGQTKQLTATGLYSDGSKQDVSSSVAWSSSTPAISSINSQGLASGVSPGSTTITATLGSVSGATSLTVTAAVLGSIAVTPSIPSAANGTTQMFTATGTYSDNSTQNLTSSVTWASSNTAVATISNVSGAGGLATATGVGQTTITAALGGVSGSTTLTVTAATLVSVAVTPPNSSLAKGTSEQLTATGTYTDHSTQNLTTLVTWSSSATTVATVSTSAGLSGQAAALSPGSTTITATMGSVSGSTGLAVTAAALASIAVTPTNASIAKGTTQQFTATGMYTDNSTQNLTTLVTWSSSDSTVAAVSNASGYDGLGTALNPGTTTVTATLGGVSGSTTLAVTAANLVSITVTPANPSIANATTQQFTAIGAYTDNSTLIITSSVTWSSSNTNFATISNASGSNGLATAVGQGSVTITAASGSVSGSTTLTVTPVTLVSIAVTPASPGVANGTTQQFTATGTYTDNSTQVLTTSVTWGSSDTSLATISNASGSYGLATAVGQGSVMITATIGSVSGSTTLTVTAATLVSIAVTPANPSILAGASQQFTATGTYMDNSVQNLTTSVTWSSSNTAISTISNASGSYGLATAVAAGPTSISATLGSITSAAQTLTIVAAEYAYVVNYADNTVSQYEIGVGGALTLIGTVATGYNPTSITVDAAGPYAYVASAGNGSAICGPTFCPLISEFSIGSGGALSSIGTFGLLYNCGATVIIADASSSSLYLACGGAQQVQEYAIGSGGVLAGLGGISDVFGPVSFAVDPIAPYVYEADAVNTQVTGYKVSASGTLSNVADVAAGTYPTSVVVDPSGSWVYESNSQDNTIRQYTIGTGGALTYASSANAGSSPACLTINPSGPYLYAVNRQGNSVSQFSIGANGALTLVNTVPTGNNPSFITIDPSGQYVYVINNSDNTVSEYAIGAGGVLASIGTAATGHNPVSISTAY